MKNPSVKSTEHNYSILQSIFKFFYELIRIDLLFKSIFGNTNVQLTRCKQYKKCTAASPKHKPDYTSNHEMNQHSNLEEEAHSLLLDISKTWLARNYTLAAANECYNINIIDEPQHIIVLKNNEHTENIIKKIATVCEETATKKHINNDEKDELITQTKRLDNLVIELSKRGRTSKAGGYIGDIAKMDTSSAVSSSSQQDSDTGNGDNQNNIQTSNYSVERLKLAQTMCLLIRLRSEHTRRFTYQDDSNALDTSNSSIYDSTKPYEVTSSTILYPFRLYECESSDIANPGLVPSEEYIPRKTTSFQYDKESELTFKTTDIRTMKQSSCSLQDLHRFYIPSTHYAVALANSDAKVTDNKYISKNQNHYLAYKITREHTNFTDSMVNLCYGAVQRYYLKLRASERDKNPKKFPKELESIKDDVRTLTKDCAYTLDAYSKYRVLLSESENPTNDTVLTKAQVTFLENMRNFTQKAERIVQHKSLDLGLPFPEDTLEASKDTAALLKQMKDYVAPRSELDLNLNASTDSSTFVL